MLPALARDGVLIAGILTASASLRTNIGALWIKLSGKIRFIAIRAMAAPMRALAAAFEGVEVMTRSEARKLWCKIAGKPRYEKGGTTSESADGTICAYDSAMRLVGRSTRDDRESANA